MAVQEGHDVLAEDLDPLADGVEAGRPAWYPTPEERLQAADTAAALSDFSLRTLASGEISFTPHVETFPLVLEARRQADRSRLLELLAENRNTVLAALAENGGLLFRGFDLAPEDFEQVPRTLGLAPALNYDFGTTRRRRIAGRVFSSTDYNHYFIIPPHAEMSYSNWRPSWLAFHCVTPPDRWGETPIFDMAGVYRDLPEELQRHYRDIPAEIWRRIPMRHSLIRTRRTVLETFGTEDREEIAAFADKLGLELKWLKPDLLEVSCRLPTVLEHPTSGALCWVSLLVNPYAYRQIYRRFADRHHPLRRFVTHLANHTVGSFAARHNNDTRLNGRPLTREEIEAVYDSLFANCSVFTWQKGDLVLLDSIRTAHGRLFYDGKRDIRACFGDNYDVRLLTAA